MNRSRNPHQQAAHNLAWLIDTATKFKQATNFAAAELNSWICAGNTKPVAQSIAIIGAAGRLINVEGHNKGLSLYPFIVWVIGADGERTCFCRATTLHQFAKQYGRDLTELWEEANMDMEVKRE